MVRGRACVFGHGFAGDRAGNTGEGGDPQNADHGHRATRAGHCQSQ